MWRGFGWWRGTTTGLESGSITGESCLYVPALWRCNLTFALVLPSFTFHSPISPLPPFHPLFLSLLLSSSLRVNISASVGEYAWTAAAGNPDRPWKARSANIDWFLVNSIATLLPAMVLPTVESDRETDDFARWKGSAGPGISCTPVDVQSPFPMSIPTVKSSRRRAPCHDYPHLATAHRPPHR